MRIHCFFVCVALWLLVSSKSDAQSQAANWRLEKDKNGIQIYTRLTEGSKFKEVKVLCEIDGTLSELFAFLSDIENYKAVVYKTKEAYMVRQVNELDFYYYTETSLPWPVKNRDLVVHMKFFPDPENKQLIIRAEDATGFVPPKHDIVRIAYWRSYWLVKKKSPSRLSIEYIFKVDPSGELPAWLVNLTATLGPYSSFVKMEENMKLPRYRAKTYSFLNF